MVGVAAISSQVLLVGDTGTRLEGELAMHGLACAKAPTANDAVARMKTTRFPFVVVSPILADMGGVDFIHGVLRHFDASVVLYGNGIESSEINALLRTGRVAHFPGNVEGHAVADFLASRAGSATPTPIPRPPSGTPAFNLTPGPPPSTPPGFSGASAPLASGGMFGSFPPSAASSFASSSFPPFAASSFPPAAAPRPPTLGPAPGLDHLGAQQGQRELQLRFEAMADELARSNAELVSMRGHIGALDQEKAALLVEVEAARRSAMADVAQVMALSDEGSAIDSEIEELKAQVARATGALDAVRSERERVVAELAETAGRMAALAAARDAADAQLLELRSGGNRDREDAAHARAELERLRMDLEAASAELDIVRENSRAEVDGVRVERNALMDELSSVRSERDVARADLDASRAALATEQDARALERSGRAEAENNLTKFRLESDSKWSTALAEESERATAAEERSDILEKQRNDLAQALADAEAKVGGGAEVESALRIESDKLRADVAGARTDATTVRLDLQEALLRLEEVNGALSAMTLERDALRDEAGPLREWGNALVAAHAQQQGELERIRPLLEAAAAQADTISDLQQQLTAKGTASGTTPETDVWLGRSRQLADLVRALEPFMWGLTQATAFYKEQASPGGEAHLRSLQQLQGVLLRLRDEIAMLDLG